MSIVTSPSRESLPPTVVSTDAIELLNPFVPDNRNEQVIATAKMRLPRRMRIPLRRLGSFSQVFLASVPLWLGDVLAIVGCSSAAALVAAAVANHPFHDQFAHHALAVALIHTVIGMAMGLFPATGLSPVRELRQLVLTTTLAFAIVLMMNALSGSLSGADVMVGLLGWIAAAMMTPLVRASVRHHFQRYDWWGEAVIVIGSGVQGQAIYCYYNRVRQRGLRPIGIVDSADQRDRETLPLLRHGIPYLGSVRRLARLGRRHSARWGIVAPGGCDGMDMNEVMRYGGNLPNLVILPSQYLLPSLWANPRECAGVMGVHVRDHLRNPLSMAVKRATDIVLSLTGLVVASPFFLIMIGWTKWKSPGPAFYGHRRIGLGGKSFKAWKFRTMVINADQVLEEHLERDPVMRQEWIEDQKLKNDPRVIAGIGHFLRKTSLDEIPQLWNVFKGEMSLVGPRPIVTSEIDRYREMFPLYLRVRPGITGLWQVSGRNDTSYEQRVRLDSYYVCNWSIWLDLYIVVRTVRTIVLREGAY